MSDTNDIKHFSDIEQLKMNFHTFATERAFAAESSFFDDRKYEYSFENKLTEEEIKELSIQEFDKNIAVYKRGFLDAILLFSK